MPTYRIARTYLVKAASKTDARRTLGQTLTSGSGDPDEWLDFESIREVTPDEHEGNIARQVLREAKSQLLGTNPQQPARSNGQS
jgi:hypothetical protein